MGGASFFLHLLRPNELFADVGANMGAYTVMVAGAVGSKCITIKPIPETFTGLMENIKLNELEKSVAGRNIGVGDKNSVIRFTSRRGTVNHALAQEEEEEEEEEE